MYNTLVPAKNEDDKSYYVLKNTLPRLINERKIQKFRRFNGWVDISKDQRNGHKNGYSGPERRLCSIVDWTLFSLPIAEQLRRGHSVEAVLGYGQKAREIAGKLKSVADTKLSVLIQGKTGTGKGIAAQILHELSERKDNAFIKVDCGAIPPTLIESELFGYEKGSFTGAFKSKPGRFQMANAGTIFLDEISNLSLDMQTRLLGFLEERMVNSIGGVKSIKLDVRVISASNANLLDQIRSGHFREDLFYRLSEFQIDLPPLNERPEDVFYLATKFLSCANAELHKNVFGFSERAIDFLSTHGWTGNIRELKNLIRRATLAADDVIEMEHLIGTTGEGEPQASLDFCLENGLVKGCSLHEINDHIKKVVERKVIVRAYEQSQRNKMKACAALGIDYSTLYRKIKEYEIE